MKKGKLNRIKAIKIIKDKDPFYEFANFEGHSDKQLLAIVNKLTEQERIVKKNIPA